MLLSFFLLSDGEIKSVAHSQDTDGNGWFPTEPIIATNYGANHTNCFIAVIKVNLKKFINDTIDFLTFLLDIPSILLLAVGICYYNFNEIADIFS